MASSKGGEKKLNPSVKGGREAASTNAGRMRCCERQLGCLSWRRRLSEGGSGAPRACVTLPQEHPRHRWPPPSRDSPVTAVATTFTLITPSPDDALSTAGVWLPTRSLLLVSRASLLLRSLASAAPLFLRLRCPCSYPPRAAVIVVKQYHRHSTFYFNATSSNPSSTAS